VEEYRKHIEKDAALERRFAPVEVKEPSEADAERILQALKPRYEAHHRLRSVCPTHQRTSELESLS
jgi:ATP-dependent Clp protease ATP-binding subunit ClpC